ncbi:MAG: DNA-3-methyladenine glycosylase 2 family protein [Myxococcota bacterium]
MREREPGFESLAKIVVEQAVSQASALAVWGRVVDLLGAVTPVALLTQGEDRLRAAGLSRSKVDCLLGMSRAVDAGVLDLDGLSEASDEEVRGALCALRGVGRWTADIYLLLALRRRDVWPAHDLALQEALRVVFRRQKRPSPREADALGMNMRPHRSTAAILLWEYYLRELSPRPSGPSSRRR